MSATLWVEWNAVSDEQVVARVLEGHTALFEVVMRRHSERLYRTIRAIVRDDGKAEELLQQAFLNAYANLRQFDGTTAFATWLTRMTVESVDPRRVARDAACARLSPIRRCRLSILE